MRRQHRWPQLPHPAVASIPALIFVLTLLLPVLMIKIVVRIVGLGISVYVSSSICVRALMDFNSCPEHLPSGDGISSFCTCHSSSTIISAFRAWVWEVSFMKVFVGQDIFRALPCASTGSIGGGLQSGTLQTLQSPWLLLKSLLIKVTPRKNANGAKRTHMPHALKDLQNAKGFMTRKFLLVPRIKSLV